MGSQRAYSGTKHSISIETKSFIDRGFQPTRIYKDHFDHIRSDKAMKATKDTLHYCWSLDLPARSFFR